MISGDYRTKLGLGTVQFGLDYGISNNSGITSSGEISKILRYALKNKITTLDTASTYGESENQIGKSVENTKDFEIISKTIPIGKKRITTKDIEKVNNGILESITKLRVNKLHGILLHNTDDLFNPNSELLFDQIISLKNEGLVKKVGISAYNTKQVELALKNFPIDIIQVPSSIFDQRFIRNGFLKKLKRLGVEIHIRSAFLQGFAFMTSDKLPISLKKYSDHLEKFHEIRNTMGLDTIDICLAYLFQQTEIDKVICGVNSFLQFKELVDKVSMLPYVEQSIFDDFALEDEFLLNPTNWTAA